ncbi:MAG: hypothetical protein J2P17_34215, partial [Mycobacterium sp.]|nr:hypothetical protein [Mycobacterium sp.]
KPGGSSTEPAANAPQPGPAGGDGAIPRGTTPGAAGARPTAVLPTASGRRRHTGARTPGT